MNAELSPKKQGNTKMEFLIPLAVLVVWVVVQVWVLPRFGIKT